MPSYRVTKPISTLKALRSPAGQKLSQFCLTLVSPHLRRRGHSSYSTVSHNTARDPSLEGLQISFGDAALGFYDKQGPCPLP